MGYTVPRALPGLLLGKSPPFWGLVRSQKMSASVGAGRGFGKRRQGVPSSPGSLEAPAPVICPDPRETTGGPSSCFLLILQKDAGVIEVVACVE